MEGSEPPSTPPKALADKRLLVLGATSLIGGFLTARLAATGADVTLVSRAPPSDGPPTLRPGMRRVQADLADPGLAARLPRVETVLSLSPIWLLPPALSALAEAGMTRLVAVSSTSRMTKIASPIAAERAVAERLAKGEAETEAACAARGVAWTILRPTLIYAEGQDRNVSRLAGLIRRLGVLPLSGAGEGLRQPVHADDLAAAAIAVIDRPSTYARTYDLPGGETLSYRDMAVRVFQGLGRRPRILAVPPGLWRMGLGLAGPLLPGATAAMGARMGSDLTFDAEPARRDFDWAPRDFRPDFRTPG